MRLVIFLFSILSSLAITAQAGHNDTTFNVTDSGYANGPNAAIRSICVLSNGQSIIAGNFTRYRGVLRGRIAKINADESLDVTFASETGANELINTITLQSDGKILIGGNFTSYDGIPCNRIARLNADGSLDNTFNTGTGFDNPVMAVAVQSDGKIIIGGNCDVFDGTNCGKLIRLNADGSVDTNFNIGSGADNIVRAIEIQADGKLLIGGSFTQMNTTIVTSVARLLANGNVDNTFDTDHQIDGDIYKIAVQADQRILIGGSFSCGTNANPYYGLIRLNSNGALDTTLINSGELASIMDIDLQPDGKIIISTDYYSTGAPGTTKVGVARLNANGSVDQSFGETISTEANNLGGPTVFASALRSNGKIVCGGDFTQLGAINRLNLASLDANGLIDGAVPNDFGTGLDASACSVRVQTDNKIIVCGAFQHFNGVAASRIVRLFPDGTRDTSFGTGSSFNGYVRYCLLQPDGKILAFGDFTQFNGITRKGMARINPDGSLDEAFNAGSGFAWLPYYYGVALQEDGKILISATGYYTFNGSTGFGNFFRLNSDGSLDSAFVYQSPPGNMLYIDKIIPLSGGKILLYRRISSGGNDNYKICRHNNDGSLDMTFTPIAVSQCFSLGQIEVQQDGKIYFVDTYSVDGNFQNVLKRYEPNGVQDTTFPATSVGSFNPFLKLMPNGQILVGCGNDDGYKIFRVNSNGTIDPTFAGMPKFDGYLEQINLQSDGKIIASGHFTEFDGAGRNRIARLFNDDNLGTQNPVSVTDAVQASFFNQTLYVASQSKKLLSVEVFDVSANKIASVKNIRQSEVHLSGLGKTKYMFVRITTEDGVTVVRKMGAWN